MQPGVSVDFGSILLSMLPMLLFIAAIYGLFAACLAVIARKTGTPGGWMAWIPIANLLLMCRIARKPGWYFLLLLIPFVNIIVAIVVWMAIARARGRSPGLVFLMFVPLVGLLVPVMLASGEPSAAAGKAASPSPPGARPQPTACPHCSTPVAAGEAFCGECGKPLVMPASPAPAAEQAASSGGGALVVAGLVLVAIVAAGWWMSARGASNDRVAPVLPARAAGAIQEFPVDIGDAPATPTSVIRQNLAEGSDDSGQEVPDEWLPPGLPSEELPRVAEAVTSASYRTAPDAPGVPVHVLESRPGDDRAAQRVARQVADAAGSDAETTGVRVTSPDGDVYEGYRIRTGQQQTFALQNTRQPIVIIIYAPQPDVFPIAERLAQNVSNGQGLQDYPIYSQTLGVLPVQPPSGWVLDDMTTFRPEDLGFTRDRLIAEMGADVPPEVQELVSWLEQFIPGRVTTARYRDPARQRFDLVAGDYGSSLRATVTWLALRALGASGAFNTIDTAAGSALWTDTDEGPLLFLRAGHVLVAAGGPRGSTAAQLVQLANTMQAVAGR